MSETEDKEKFETEIRILQAEIANAAAHLTIDVRARQAYSRRTMAMSIELRNMATSGRISWAQAADQASQVRNLIMDLTRTRSTPLGRAIAQKLKENGRNLDQLISERTTRLYGPRADFTRLSQNQQNQVYSEIVKSAGKSNPRVNSTMSKLSNAGRGLIVLALTLSVYNIATAEDKVAAVQREGAITGAGIAGGFAGGALAGLACGPGAPVCVTVGAFVGGALAAFGVNFIW